MDNNLKSLKTDHYRRDFYSFIDFEKSKDKNELKSIIFKNIYTNYDQFIKFILDLPINGSLEAVEFSGYLNCSFDLEIFCLPPTIKSLNLGEFKPKLTYSDKDIINFKNSFSNLSSFTLPVNLYNQQNIISNSFENLTSLDTGNFFKVQFEKDVLPKTLIHLRLGREYIFEILKDTLPATLESLTIESNYQHENIALPNNLKILKIISNNNLKINILKSIPISITNLSLLCYFDDTSYNYKLEHLKSLKKLSLGYTQVNSFVGPENEKKNGYNLPPSLKTLKILNGVFDVDSLPKYTKLNKLLLNSNVKVVQQNLGAGYPGSITKFKGDYTKHFVIYFQKPENIKTLELSFTSDTDNSCEFSNFKNLTSLIVSRCSSPIINLIKVDSLPESLINCEYINDYDKIKNLDNNKCYNSTGVDKTITKTLTYKVTYGRDHDIQEIFYFQNYANKLYNILSYRENDQNSILLTNEVLNNPNSVSPFNDRLLLLDLDFTFNKNNQFLNSNHLPKNIQILILRGENTPKFNIPLPNSLKTIYINGNNKTILKDKSQMEILEQYLKIFYNDDDLNNYPNSKIFKKLKYII